MIENGAVLVGGSPIRLLRLTPAGRSLVDRLAAGEPVPSSPAAQALTRRLLDAGLAHPRPPAPAFPPDVAVVIPVHNDAGGLAATLAALAKAGASPPAPAKASKVGAGAPPPAGTPQPAAHAAAEPPAGTPQPAAHAAAPSPAGTPQPAARAAAEPPAVERSGRAVVVVDDGSGDAAGVAAVARAGTATLLRRSACGGPAAARNDGWRATTAELVAFVDANCVPEPGWLDALLPHFADRRVAAVAPRIVAAAEPSAPRWLAAYEAVSSPLDLGPREASVRPRSPVAYVPTAALVVRRTALEAADGFDERLTVGEDVDLVWRLVAAGWTVRYEPRATVRHPMRATVPAWLAQRYRYGTSAAALARRHGEAVAPAVLSPWTAAAWGLVAAGAPLAGAAVAGVSIAALAGAAPRRAPGRRSDVPSTGETPTEAAGRAAAAGDTHVEPAGREVAPGDARAESVGRRAAPGRLPVREGVRLAGLGQVGGGLSLARAARRAWPPAAVLVAVASRRSRPSLAAAVVVPPLVDWLARRPRLDPVRFSGLRLADDLAYAAGLWAGCARERSVRALLPAIAAGTGPGGRKRAATRTLLPGRASTSGAGLRQTGGTGVPAPPIGGRP